MLASIRVVLVLLLMGLSFGIRAEVPVPPLTSRVTDLTGTLTSQQSQTLEQTLREFQARQGSQIAVLIIPTTLPETIEQYGIRVADQWKIGRKKLDDGAILIVAKNDRTMRIEVGYGLEGVLTDATSEDIITDVVAPFFRRGDFYGGINAGVEWMIRVVSGEPLPRPNSDQTVGSTDIRQYAPVVLLLALLVGGFLRSALGRVPGAVVAGGVLGLLAWIAVGALSIAFAVGLIAFLFTLLGGGMMGPLLGGFGRGGIGGGGFSGGGGAFGGGGASGRW